MFTPLLIALSLPLGGVSAACTRSFLQSAADTYLAAIAAGNATLLSPVGLTNTTSYGENDVSLPITSGVLSAPIKVDHSRHLLDTTQCATFTELTATQPSHPYVIHTRIVFASSSEPATIAKIESVVSDTGDWIFNATAFLQWTTSESWGPIPAEKRSSREVIKAAGDAYLDQWGNVSHPVPLGTPCSRLEGGLYTGARNLTTNSCAMGAFPSPLNVTNRRYVIDEEIGAMDIFNDFPFLESSFPVDKGTPSSNLFRVEGGLIRYIHEVTVCATRNCGR